MKRRWLSLSYTEIRSPIAGVVADRPAFAGEMASPGVALVTILDVSSVIARVNISQSEAAWVKVGQAARIVSSDGAVESDGKVTVVSPAVRPAEHNGGDLDPGAEPWVATAPWRSRSGGHPRWRCP